MTVVQVLLVNVLTDGLPAIALARDPAAPQTMDRGPQRGDRLFPPRAWARWRSEPSGGQRSVRSSSAGRATEMPPRRWR